jgi:exopolyphosphatase / guanosine-5'-triphosphate,3'-diphosphate pyrophosphatase
MNINFTMNNLTEVEKDALFIERRVAFDVGSGKIKMQISDIDVSTNRIVKAIFSDGILVGFSRDLANSPNKQFSLQIQDKAIQAFSQLKAKADKFQPKAYHGVATEAFRLAENSNELLVRIKNDLNIKIEIIEQDEEGILGFITAINEVNIQPNKAVVWDIGSGSFQMTTKYLNEYFVYKGKLGRITMKDTIINEIQSYHSDVSTPNPISMKDVNKSLDHIKKQVKDIPDYLCKMLSQPDTIILGIGAYPKVILASQLTFSSQDIFDAISAKIDQSDQDLSKEISEFGNSPEFILSDLILVYGIMLALGIQQVRYVITQGGNTTGVLISPQYWTNLSL